MQTITIPKLHYPFNSELNPHVEKLKQHTGQWIIEFGLRDSQSIESFHDENYTYLVSRFYPNADYNELCICNDLTTLLFLIDDQLENPLEKSDLKKEQNLKNFVRKFMMILRQEISLDEKEDHPIFTALKDIWKRLTMIKNDDWVILLIAEIEKFFEAVIWESGNFTQKRIPISEEYIEKRRFLSASNIAIILLEFLENIQLPKIVRENPIVLELEKCAGNIIGISNDLFSLSKEREYGDTHNLISILEYERKISLEEAILLTVKIHNEEVNKFIKLSENLPFFDDKTNENLKKYVNLLGIQLAGNLEWSLKDTNRYDFVYDN